jgi:hypothetical protein
VTHIGLRCTFRQMRARDGTHHRAVADERPNFLGDGVRDRHSVLLRCISRRLRVVASRPQRCRAQQIAPSLARPCRAAAAAAAAARRAGGHLLPCTPSLEVLGAALRQNPDVAKRVRSRRGGGHGASGRSQATAEGRGAWDLCGKSLPVVEFIPGGLGLLPTWRRRERHGTQRCAQRGAGVQATHGDKHGCASHTQRQARARQPHQVAPRQGRGPPRPRAAPPTCGTLRSTWAACAPSRARGDRRAAASPPSRRARPGPCPCAPRRVHFSTG